MNKWRKPFIFVGLSTLLLTGCGSATESDKTANQTPESQQASAPEASKEEQPAAEQDKKKEEGSIRVLEQNLDYTLNGEQKQQTGFLKNSDNQNYSMYVLPEYEWTAEEPNKDVLMLTEDDSIFMRIELLPADTEWAMAEENAKAQLSAAGAEVKETAMPDDAFFNNAWGMETKNGADNITTYLIKNEEQPLKLTIFTKEGADHRDAFIQMAKTIMKQQN